MNILASTPGASSRVLSAMNRQVLIFVNYLFSYIDEDADLTGRGPKNVAALEENGLYDYILVSQEMLIICSKVDCSAISS